MSRFGSGRIALAVVVALAFIAPLLPTVPGVSAEEPTHSEQPSSKSSPTLIAQPTPSLGPTPSPSPQPTSSPPAPTEPQSTQPLPTEPLPTDPGATPTPSPTAVPSPTPSPSPTPTPTPPPPPPPPPPAPRLGQPEIFGYLPYWDLDAQIDYGAITTIAYFGLGAGADGKLVRRTATGSLQTEYSRWLGTKVRGIINQAHANGVKFVLTVERMAWSDGGKEATIQLLSSPTARTTLVNEIVNEIVTRGIDGVSLDFEPLLSTQRDNFAALVRELRLALNAVNPMYQMTFATTGSLPTLTHEMAAGLTRDGWADAVIIMAYPLRAIDHKYAGGLAPLYSPTSYDLKQIVAAYLRYQSGSKIVLALPWYGRYYPTLTDQLNSQTQTDEALYYRAHNIGYEDAVELAARHGRLLDPSEQSAWTVYRWRYCSSCPETWRQVYYDDVDTLAYKYEWAREKGLAGIGIWALGYDNDRPEMWKVLRLKYRGLVDTSAPTGSISVVEEVARCASTSGVRLGFAVTDEEAGSGPAFVRLSNVADREDGVLVHGRTYPLPTEVEWSLEDPTTGGIAGAGDRSVHAQFRDVAGNWSSVSVVGVTASAPASADMLLASDAVGVTTESVPVSIVHSGGRPIVRALLSLSALRGADGVLSASAEVPVGVPYMLSLVDAGLGGVPDDGPRSVYAQWQDSAGCWSEPVTASVTLDRTPPAGTLSLVGSPTLVLEPTVQVAAPATDLTTGVKTLALSNNGLAWTEFAMPDAPIEWTADGVPDGTWEIHARWRDGAGNWSAVARVSVQLDTGAPSGTVVLAGGAIATAAESVSVAAAAADAGGNVVEMLLSNRPETTDGLLTGAASFTPGDVAAWPLNGAGTAAGVADGTHTVYAQWRDGAGRWSDVASDSIVVDRTAPTVTLPTVRLVSGGRLVPGVVPVDVAWQAVDAGTGVREQLLRIAPAGTPVVGQVDAQVVTPPVSVTIGTGQPWTVQVSATDHVGNVTATGTPGSISARVQEETPTVVAYSGTWRKSSTTSASGGSTRYATVRGATATLTFTGRAVAWVAPTGARFGKAKVFVDGVLAGVVDLAGSSASTRRLVFAANWNAAGTHRIKIKVLGTSGRPRVDVDAFVVLG